MAKNLVIVESPSKSKTIEKYLGNDYKVVSSKGHIRDLSTKGKYGLGVDIENDFKPDYVTIKGKTKTISELKKDAKDARHIYLATDPDREGEAISWHLYDVLKLKEKDYDRVVFHEITKGAVTEAFKHTRKIDDKMVSSQETRRILDRIIGFRLSKLMQSKTSGSSAGRVQSVALKLIVDKEREIEAFIPEEYWTITAHLKLFDADLFSYKGKEIEVKNEEEADKILNFLGKEFTVSSIQRKTKSKNSKPAFITSTLQQEASNKLGLSPKRTMSIAQKLYEGIDLGSETVGLITYMRTDSIRLSDEFIKATYSYIDKNYGAGYVGSVKTAKKTENVQDAHEAIRPTSISRSPESVKDYLSKEEYKLYRFIYYRALASLMSNAKTENTTILLKNHDYEFKTTGSVIVFDGYLKVYAEYEDVKDTILPEVKGKEILSTDDVTKEQHFTKAPSRYTEAKLIKEMEELGIGRPSTYATIMDNIKTRGYVKLEEKHFIPTSIGIEVTDKLQEYFSHIINVKYTANMETDLDKIAEGTAIWNQVLKDFYKDFGPALNEAFGKMEKAKPEETGELCPECGNPLVKRKGRYGEFTACSNYPTCKYIKKEIKEVKEICDCPNCDGKIVERKSKRGKLFYGCNHYPKCKTAYWDKPIGELCPECHSMLVEHNHKVKCSNCEYQK